MHLWCVCWKPTLLCCFKLEWSHGKGTAMAGLYLLGYLNPCLNATIIKVYLWKPSLIPLCGRLVTVSVDQWRPLMAMQRVNSLQVEMQRLKWIWECKGLSAWVRWTTSKRESRMLGRVWMESMGNVAVQFMVTEKIKLDRLTFRVSKNYWCQVSIPENATIRTATCP